MNVRVGGRTIHDVLRMTIAEAVHFAHQRGTLHRDLKPQNVMIDAQDHVRITDFGLVKRLESEDQGATRTGTIMGTPSYMAPEQGRGQKDVGPLADVYSRAYAGATFVRLVMPVTEPKRDHK